MAQNPRRPSAPAPHAPRLEGVVIATFGRHFEVSTASGILRCVTRGKQNAYACGDEIELTPTTAGEGVIEALHPRRNLLWRSDAFRQKLLAANLDQIIVVVATEPGFSTLLISRCLAAAESEGIDALIVLNKADLSAQLPPARKRLHLFATLGYPVLELCALDGAAALAAQIEGKKCLLVGQSGMGKSTLTNALTPEACAATAAISIALDSGKHTTTLARLYPRGSGWLVDSPGLQAFGLAHLAPEHLAHAFIEFRPLLGQCRFRDCRHDNEPGCALTAASASGVISSQRLAHYHAIRNEIAAARKANPGR
ncbi:putative ribosome biogenesis GTPase RsgA [Betaproteobacteria bacterium]|nr:putative ribosome biogenesis GTPase RsgA [Betaproteobacteria bacterium]